MESSFTIVPLNLVLSPEMTTTILRSVSLHTFFFAWHMPTEPWKSTWSNFASFYIFMFLAQIVLYWITHFAVCFFHSVSFQVGISFLHTTSRKMHHCLFTQTPSDGHLIVSIWCHFFLFLFSFFHPDSKETDIFTFHFCASSAQC